MPRRVLIPVLLAVGLGLGLILIGNGSEDPPETPPQDAGVSHGTVEDRLWASYRYDTEAGPVDMMTGEGPRVTWTLHSATKTLEEKLYPVAHGGGAPEVRRFLYELDEPGKVLKVQQPDGETRFRVSYAIKASSLEGFDQEMTLEFTPEWTAREGRLMNGLQAPRSMTFVAPSPGKRDAKREKVASGTDPVAQLRDQVRSTFDHSVLGVTLSDEAANAWITGALGRIETSPDALIRGMLTEANGIGAAIAALAIASADVTFEAIAEALEACDPREEGQAAFTIATVLLNKCASLDEVSEVGLRLLAGHEAASRVGHTLLCQATLQLISPDPWADPAGIPNQETRAAWKEVLSTPPSVPRLLRSTLEKLLRDHAPENCPRAGGHAMKLVAFAGRNPRSAEFWKQDPGSVGEFLAACEREIELSDIVNEVASRKRLLQTYCIERFGRPYR